MACSLKNAAAKKKNPRIKLTDVHIQIPSGTGLGIEIDWDKVEELRLDIQ